MIGFSVVCLCGLRFSGSGNLYKPSRYGAILGSHHGLTYPYLPKPSPAGFKYTGNHHRQTIHSHPYLPSASPPGFNYDHIYHNSGHSSPYMPTPSPAGFNYDSINQNSVPTVQHVHHKKKSHFSLNPFKWF